MTTVSLDELYCDELQVKSDFDFCDSLERQVFAALQKFRHILLI